MVIFEDLHWIDDETQVFLNLLADSIGTAKILLLVNYRPEYSHQWDSKTYYTQLRLDPLAKSQPKRCCRRCSAIMRSEPLKRLIIEKTEGNPFFMEETVQVLLDEGALVREGSGQDSSSRWRVEDPTDSASDPRRAHRSSAAGGERLAADPGRDWQGVPARSRARVPWRYLHDELNRMLDDLQLGEFIYEQPAVGDVEYTFKHALTQEVAYQLGADGSAQGASRTHRRSDRSSLPTRSTITWPSWRITTARSAQRRENDRVPGPGGPSRQ